MPDADYTLAQRILSLLSNQRDCPSATTIAKRLQDNPSSVSSLLNRMSQEGGPLVRIPGKGPRGGYGYALRPYRTESVVRKSRYELLSEEDWL